MSAKNTTKNATAELFAPAASTTKAPRRRAVKKTAVAAAVAAAVTATAPAIVTAAPAQAQAPAFVTAAPAQAQAPAIVTAAPAQAGGLTWQKTLPRAKNEGTNLFSFRHGIEFTAIDGKIRFSRAQLALSMDDLKGAFGSDFAKWIKASVKSWPARFITENGPSRNYVWCFADILKIAGKTAVRKQLRAALTKYYNAING